MLELHEAAERFAAVGSEPRLAVVKALVRAGHEGLSVGEIQERLDIPASTLAHHLRSLEAANLVEQDRQGRTVVNRVVFEEIEALSAYLLRECCVEARPKRQASGSRIVGRRGG
ncbi:ArsR/SmtB family transcription factor [Arenicellales bacterium nBUS_48]